MWNENAIKIILSLFLTSGVSLHATDDEGDARQPVVVRTKHASLSTRSLPRLIELTEKHSPDVQKAQSLLTVAQLEYGIASKQWLPSLDFSTTDGLAGESPNTVNFRTSPWTSSLDLRLSESLYDNGRSITQYNIAKQKLARGQLEFELARDRRFLAVANAYYDWSSALQQREILENKRDLLRRQFNVMETLYKQGIKTKRDVLRIESEMRRLEIAVVNSDNDVDLGFQKMAASIGVSREGLLKEEIEGHTATPYVKDDFNYPPIDPQNHKQAKVYEFQRKEAELSTDLVRRENLPRLSLTGDVGYHNSDYLFNKTSSAWDANHYWDWSALVTLEYNFWDFGIRGRKVEIARVQEARLNNEYRQGLLDLGTDLRNVSLQLRSFRESVKMTRELLVLEQQAYGILEADYRNGRSSYLDLITNLNSLVDARARFVDSYFGLKKQQVLYSFHQGNLYETLKK